MKYSLLPKIQLIVLACVALIAVVDVSGQTKRRRSIPIPAPTATPVPNEPMIISRADEFPDENSRAIPPDPSEQKATGADSSSVTSLEDLGNRIRNLEASREP